MQCKPGDIGTIFPVSCTSYRTRISTTSPAFHTPLDMERNTMCRSHTCQSAPCQYTSPLLSITNNRPITHVCDFYHNLVQHVIYKNNCNTLNSVVWF